MIAALHYPSRGSLPKAFVSLMKVLRLCPHANVGWPIRCDGEEKPSQHCFDCGAQRTYTLQPRMQKGPWERPQLCSTQPFEIAFSSNARSESMQPERLTRCLQIVVTRSARRNQPIEHR